MVTNPATEFRLPLPYNKMGEYNQNSNIGQQGLEFDGTTVLCRVCGDKASGFHYGVHSCEGCKGFFRRSIQQKIQYRPCTKNQQCSILRVNRNRCQYCRLKKCITVGMSRDAVRFGRVPKREKAKILAAMQASHINKTNELILNEGLSNMSELKSVIINAHYSTCDFTKGKIETLIKEQSLSSRSEKFGSDGGVRTASASTSSFLTCPLNPINYSSEDDIDDNFSDRFSPAIRGVVEFAKLLPGFNTLTQDDQIILLKNGVFEVLLLRLSNMFLDNNTMLCINGKVVNIINIEEEGGRTSPSNNPTSSAKFLIKSMFKFTTSFNQWNLDDDIIGVFSAIILMSWDRPGLRNPDLIKKLQSHYRAVLHTLLPSEVCNALESKIPDLRTLNTLHSEKLLSFKMDGIKSNKGVQEAMEDDEVSRETTTSISTSISSGSPPSLSSQPVNIPSHHSCPYANGGSNTTTIFPVSPSNDSGIESGACSSPSRSEVSETFYNGSEESMPVLKRALQAPPLIDNQYIPTNYYNEGRRSPEMERNYHYNVGHKKFRRSTITPPSDMTTSPRTSTSSPPQQQQPATIPNQYNNQIKQETITSTYYDNQLAKPKETTPVQLYPQLASALTRPLANYSNSYHSSSNMEMSTLKQSLLKPTISNVEETSNYIHSLIMRDEYGPPVPAPPPSVRAATITRCDKMSLTAPARTIQETNPSPLNLCMKSTAPSAATTAKPRNGIAT